jgi:hypothetical protein
MEDIMSANYDIASLYQFLTQTPEGGLRKMLIDGKPVTEVHFNLLMKVVKYGVEEDFKKFCETNSFPPVRVSPKEVSLKETFWADCLKTLQARGILQPGGGKAAA